MAWTKMVDDIILRQEIKHTHNQIDTCSVFDIFDKISCDLERQTAVEFGEDYGDMYDPLSGIPDDDL